MRNESQPTQEEMSGFTQDPEDYYQACFQSSPNPINFSDHQGPYMGMSINPIQKEFQQSGVKEETNERVVTEENSVQSSASKKMLKRQKSEEATSPSSLEQGLISQRRKRTVYSQHQLDVLEEFFQTNMYPDIHHREELAKRIYIPESRIQVWFQNRRGKARREKSKVSLFNNVGICYPNIRPPVNHVHTGPTLAPPEQHQPMMPQQQGQTPMTLPQDMYRQPVDPMPYPPFSCAVRERMMMNQVSPNPYYQSPQVGNQQRSYKNITSMNTKAVDLTCRPNQIPTQLNFMTDFNAIPPNKTITPDMNIKIPPIPMSSDSRGANGMNPFTAPFPFKMSSMEDDYYEQSSPDSDSGVSDRSPESGSDSKESISSVICL
ncbi:homeobox protein Mix.2-like [Hyla sarda]|uniref:homeobox protein Mix.2-like n=1 Tax=Hyla sarda TaxID=327740 RepID=UPI0024C2891E|nr:homeobox protein Mix.2-like [Hyla sarda]XP_056424477.1 homeobox protein Mix.2-like [Hyla sarda]